MTMTDPIADMLTRIRNANTVGHETVEIPASRIKKSIAEILLEEGGLGLRLRTDLTNSYQLAFLTPGISPL